MGKNPSLGFQTKRESNQSHQLLQRLPIKLKVSKGAKIRNRNNQVNKDIANTRQNKNIKDPQKKYRLGTVSKIFSGGLKPV